MLCRSASNKINGYVFEFNDVFDGQWRSFRLTLTTGRLEAQKQTFVNLEMYIDANWKNLVSGLCDRYTGATHADLLPRGATTPIAASQANVDSVFGPSWRVKCNEVGFDGFEVTECNAPPPLVYTPRM